MKFSFAPHGSNPAYDPAAAIGCDGLPPAKLCLSHWPGHTTPTSLLHDLSTGIALAYSRLPGTERRARFGTFEFAVNDHFDCDGLLAIFACVNPGAAIPRTEAMLLAASAGDHWRAPSPRALAFDLAVSCFTDPARSPLGSSLTPLTQSQRDELAYNELLARMPGGLDDPWSLGCSIGEEFARIEDDMAFLKSGGAKIDFHPSKHLAVVDTPRRLDTRALFEICGTERFFVLERSRQGLLAEIRISSLSWFETSRARFPKRPDLDTLAARFQESERGAGKWIASGVDDPFPSVQFGAARSTGAFRDPAADPVPTSLDPDALVKTALEFL